MEQVLLSASTKKKSSVTRLTKNSKILKAIVNAIKDKKGENIVLLDLRKIPEAVADFFVICEANNHVQVKAIAGNVEYQLKEDLGEITFRHEGMQAANWILLDYVNVVVHVMHSETRKFYRLEEMWSDGGMEEL